MSTITTTSQSATSPTSSKLDLYARWGIWALPVWTLLLFLGTLTHQPSTQTDFPGYARYITTTEFLDKVTAAADGLESVRLMRKAVGPDFELMVDAHTWWRMGDRSYSAETVEQMARAAEFPFLSTMEPE